MKKSILFSALPSIVTMIIILIVIPTIQLQPLQNRQALAQNMTLAHRSGNLTGLMKALNTIGSDNNSNISPALQGEEQQRQQSHSLLHKV